MQQKGIISTNQFVWMLFSVITSFTALQIPGMLIAHAGRDAWLAVASAWFLDVLLAMVYAHMGLRFPGQNCIQYSITILGKFAGSCWNHVSPILSHGSLAYDAVTCCADSQFIPAQDTDRAHSCSQFHFDRIRCQKRNRSNCKNL